MLPRKTKKNSHALYGQPDKLIQENSDIEIRLGQNKRKELWTTYQGVPERIQTLGA